MGTIYFMNCQECGFDLKLRWGVGMLFMHPEHLPGMLPKRQGEKVREMMDRPDLKKVRYNYQLYICPRCILPSSRLNYRVEFEGGEIYQPNFRCSYCRAKLVETEEFPHFETCPRCDSSNLITGRGDWD